MDNFHQITTLCANYGVVRIVRKEGSLKHYETKFRRWLKQKQISHIFTISNQGTQLYIWITGWFNSRRLTPQILGAVCDDNSIIDEAYRPIALIIDELNLKLKTPSIKLEEVCKENSLERLALQQLESGVITKEEYDQIIVKL